MDQSYEEKRMNLMRQSLYFPFKLIMHRGLKETPRDDYEFPSCDQIEELVIKHKLGFFTQQFYQLTVYISAYMVQMEREEILKIFAKDKDILATSMKRQEPFTVAGQQILYRKFAIYQEIIRKTQERDWEELPIICGYNELGFNSHRLHSSPNWHIVYFRNCPLIVLMTELFDDQTDYQEQIKFLHQIQKLIWKYPNGQMPLQPEDFLTLLLLAIKLDYQMMMIQDVQKYESLTYHFLNEESAKIQRVFDRYFTFPAFQCWLKQRYVHYYEKLVQTAREREMKKGGYTPQQIIHTPKLQKYFTEAVVINEPPIYANDLDETFQICGDGKSIFQYQIHWEDLPLRWEEKEYYIEENAYVELRFSLDQFIDLTLENSCEQSEYQRLFLKELNEDTFRYSLNVPTQEQMSKGSRLLKFRNMRFEMSFINDKFRENIRLLKEFHETNKVHKFNISVDQVKFIKERFHYFTLYDTQQQINYALVKLHEDVERIYATLDIQSINNHFIARFNIQDSLIQKLKDQSKFEIKDFSAIDKEEEEKMNL